MQRAWTDAGRATIVSLLALLFVLAVGVYGAQDSNVNPPIQFPAWLLYCPGTESGIIGGCQYIKLDPGSFRLTPDAQYTDPAHPVVFLGTIPTRKYGVKLTWSGPGLTGLPVNAANVAMVANGIRIFADKCWYQNQSGQVIFAPACTGPMLFGIPLLIDSTWDIRADFDPPLPAAGLAMKVSK